MRLSNAVKSTVIVAFVLLFLVFYNSKRIETLAVGAEDSFMGYLGAVLAASSEKIKSSLGANGFFENEEKFWTKVKISPVIFGQNLEYQQRESNIGLEKPQPVPVFEMPDKIEPPFSILIVGDSFIAEALGPSLEKELILYENVKVKRRGMYSTGLSRPDYFDWNEEIKELIASEKPNVAVVMFGANDGQDLRFKNGEIIHYYDKAWNPEYASRVDVFLKILNDNGVFVFWVGNPIARDIYYSNKMKNLNSLYQAGCEKTANCLYVSTWEVLADSNGEYSAYLPDETGAKKLARASDGIHTTSFGSRILVKEVISKMKEKLELQPQEND